MTMINNPRPPSPPSTPPPESQPPDELKHAWPPLDELKHDGAIQALREHLNVLVVQMQPPARMVGNTRSFVGLEEVIAKTRQVLIRMEDTLRELRKMESRK